MDTNELKLYSLVHVAEPRDDVQAGFHCYIGQVLSRPTPDGTTMIRRVPGHAGTLVELPTAYLSPAEARRAYVVFAVVTGRGSFPTDMLRYDNCVPVNFTIEKDELGAPRAKLIDGFGSEMLVARCVNTRTVAVIHPFTTERWNSFLWSITTIGIEDIDT